MEQQETRSLFARVAIGKLELNNRIVMAPMTRGRGIHEGHLPTEIMESYYAQRATAGLIISEGVIVSEMANGYVQIPGIYNQQQVEGWKKITAKVHAQGGKLFAQIWHVGRISHPDVLGGKLPLAPSAINPGFFAFTPTGPKDTVTPQAMSLEDIQQTVADFGRAAANAIAAGFDGVEIHGANGYLFHQFLATTANQRTDAYGGSAANRARFLFEVVDAVTQAIGAERTGIRLNPDMDGVAGIHLNAETSAGFDYVVEKLNGYQLAYLHLTSAMMAPPDGGAPAERILKTAKWYRGLYQGTLILNGGFDKETGQKAINDGLADLIAYGSPFIANPNLVERYRHDLPLATPDADLLYVGGEKGYIDYPAYTEKIPS